MQTIFCLILFNHFLHPVKPIQNEQLCWFHRGNLTLNTFHSWTRHVKTTCTHLYTPNTLLSLQSLDISFMLLLSTFYSQKNEIWLRQNTGTFVVIRQVVQLFRNTCWRAATPSNAEN
jgi:hypothetical protein